MTENLVPLPSHPPPGPTFADWFKSFSRIIPMIAPCDIFSEACKTLAKVVGLLQNEVIYELDSKANRQASSVYDRSDYVVRELLRTTKITAILEMCRQTAHQLLEGNIVFGEDGVLQNKKGEKMDPSVSCCLMFELPSILVLCFTAQETVGIISLDELLTFSREALLSAVNAEKFPAITEKPVKHTLYSAALAVLTSCVENMKVLNITLFFSVFQDRSLFELIVKFVLKVKDHEDGFLADMAFLCLNAYIKVTQSEEDRKRCAADPDFVELYRTMMKEVVEPQVAKNRSKFRSILFYSRTLK